MGRTKQPRIAICYDFDGTLSPRNMQEYDFIPQLNIRPNTFWKEVAKRAKEQKADEILVYMCLMLEKAIASNDVQVTKQSFQDYGKTVKLFDGVEGWFNRINDFVRNAELVPEHYIISSGIREMIEGTSIASEIKSIFASSFTYDQHDVARWPGLAINYTTKTQFLFRINKGNFDVWDNKKINEFVPKRDRPIPFERIIYIGDGSTDVPCMKLVKDQGGHSIAVYKPKTSKASAEQLLKDDRVNFFAPADYRTGKQLERIVKAIIKKVAGDYAVEKLGQRLAQREEVAVKREDKSYMSNQGADHVVPCPNGGWSVQKSRAKKASCVHATRKEAESGESEVGKNADTELRID